jgi:hypothetical protein
MDRIVIRPKTITITPKARTILECVRNSSRFGGATPNDIAAELHLAATRLWPANAGMYMGKLVEMGLVHKTSDVPDPHMEPRNVRYWLTRQGSYVCFNTKTYVYRGKLQIKQVSKTWRTS